MDISERYIKLIAENLPFTLPKKLSLLVIPCFGFLIPGLILAYKNNSTSGLSLIFLIIALTFGLLNFVFLFYFKYKTKKKFLKYYQEHNSLPPWTSDGKFIEFPPE